MKVIKVIVDAMPENCVNCPYLEVVTVQIGEKCSFNWQKIDDSLVRPDWCPLMLESDVVLKTYAADQLRQMGYKEDIDGFYAQESEE